MLAGRVPRLHEKIVDIRLVDGANRRVRIRVGSQESPLSAGKDLPCLLQKTDAIYARHSLVRE
jgi:hypothetical protein